MGKQKGSGKDVVNSKWHPRDTNQEETISELSPFSENEVRHLEKNLTRAYGTQPYDIVEKLFTR